MRVVEVLRLYLSLRNGPLYFISWKFYFFPRGNLREVLFCGQKSLALLLLVAAVAANEEVEADLGIFFKKKYYILWENRAISSYRGERGD